MEMREGVAGKYKLRDHAHPKNAHTWPTPKSTVSGPDYARTNRSGGGDDLATSVARMLWPTPANRDYKGQNGPKHLIKERGHHDQLPNAVAIQGQTGQLNPAWVECLMNFPVGWTELNGPLAPVPNTPGNRHV